MDEYNRMLTQATEPLSTFLEYITWVLTMQIGSFYVRVRRSLGIATLAVAQNTRQQYRLVLSDTPLGPYFSECITSEKLGGATSTIMCDLLAFEADRRAVNIANVWCTVVIRMSM